MSAKKSKNEKVWEILFGKSSTTNIKRYYRHYEQGITELEIGLRKDRVVVWRKIDPIDVTVSLHR